jgi:DNA-binding MarR family transcriptional regulator
VTTPLRQTAAELASLLRPSLVRLTRIIRNQRVELALTLTQLSALSTLERSGPMSAGELATCERVQPPSMTKVLASLEELKYVRREGHPTDRRQAIIVLTDAGHELMDSERKSRDEWMAQRLAKLSADERDLVRQVIPVLDKLAEL